jgi:hypothetical protein
VSKELLQIYVQYIRPHAARSIETSPDREPLLLNFLHGGHNANVGQAITHFYIGESEIHLTTTGIRSLLETTAEHLYRQGHLSTEAKKSVEGINGHSSAVVKNYYLKLNRAEEVHHARALFETSDFEPYQDDATSQPCQDDPSSLPYQYDAISEPTYDPSSSLLSIVPTGNALANFSTIEENEDLGHWVWSTNQSQFSSPSRTPPPPTPSSRFLSPSRTPSPHPPRPPQTQPLAQSSFRKSDDLEHWVWGRDHPEKNTNPAKVKWSDEELDFIRIWISINTTEGTRNPIARCLDAIKINPQARHIFHQHHVLNSGRLRAGYDRVSGKLRARNDQVVE